MIIKSCTKCGGFFRDNGTGRCEKCRKSDDKKENDKIYNQRYRNKHSDKFYHSAQWKRLSKAVLAKASYKCADCGGLATEVHHIVEINDDWSKRFDLSNLVPLCTSCHNKQR